MGSSPNAIKDPPCKGLMHAKSIEAQISPVGIFARKILRCIFGGIQVNGKKKWKEERRSNLELYKIYKKLNIVKFVKLQKLKWAGHLAKMNVDRCSKKIFLAMPMGNRTRGRPPLRSIDCVEKDLNILKVKHSGKQLPKVEMTGEDFWIISKPTQGC
ncbi:hypothetical protein TNCV_4481621 [Trichonephila clavipes]|nr:hypothetical protein TNCV_4481621 [Trichonephila clavipes]